ncbi:hypothetical protein CPB86DRAFT_829011 [Serendipita vermifera]|nr:hypothetical protein CPB86DRAFT_829011 [Serendipita vermifera]
MSSYLLENLADELILEIIKYLDFAESWTDWPYSSSIEVFALSLCCRRLRRITLPLLYHTIVIPGPKSLERIIQIVIQSPTHAHLVKNLTLDWSQSITFPGWPCQNHTIDFSNEARKYNLPSHFISELRFQGQTWAYGLFLMHLLVDLEVVRFKMGRGQYSEVFGSYLSTFLFERLVSNKLRFISWNAGQPVDNRVLIPAFLCPSVTRIHGHVIVSDGPIDRPQFRYKNTSLESWYGTSSVEVLCLSPAKIQASDLSDLLQLPRNLKAFIYYGYGYRSWPYGSSTLGPFRQSLDIVSKSLRRLDIRWDEDHMSNDDPVVWSFDNFVALKSLRISYTLVYGLELDATPCIVDKLPPTFQVLAMYEPRNHGWDKEKFVEKWRVLLVKKSDICLTYLRVIGHLRSFEVLEPLVGLAGSHNVKVALDEADMI